MKLGTQITYHEPFDLPVDLDDPIPESVKCFDGFLWAAGKHYAIIQVWEHLKLELVDPPMLVELRQLIGREARDPNDVEKAIAELRARPVEFCECDDGFPVTGFDGLVCSSCFKAIRCDFCENVAAQDYFGEWVCKAHVEAAIYHVADRRD